MAAALGITGNAFVFDLPANYLPVVGLSAATASRVEVPLPNAASNQQMTRLQRPYTARSVQVDNATACHHKISRS
jgi:hypothetical protein